MNVMIRSGLSALGLLAAAAMQAQQPTLSPEAAAALEELAPRFASEAPLIQGWFRDRPVLYYDFGTVPAGVQPARVYWPIHGFDARRNPVAIRGQRPIFTTIPGLSDYTGLWRLIYVVTADKVQPNELKDQASIDAAIRARKALLSESDVTLNLPITPRGTTLARDTTPGTLGWYQGRDVQFFDFGVATLTAVPMWRFVRGKDAAGEPNILAAQNSIIDSIPLTPPYPDVWAISFVEADSAYAPNSITNAATLRGSKLVIGPVSAIRNLPVTIVDGAPVKRADSPIRAFADMRSPFPPKPTPPLIVR